MSGKIIQATQDRGLRIKAVAQLFGVSVSTIWVWARRPDFPKRIKITSRTTVFMESELLQWLERQRQAK